MEERAGMGSMGDSGAGQEPAPRRRILAVGVESALYGVIEALLNRSYFEVDRVPRGESGRILCGAMAFDLVLVRFPLPDVDAADFLAALRDPASPCAQSQVLLLADEQQLSRAQALVGPGANVALSAARTDELLSEVAARLLHVAPRVATRIMVRLQARVSDGDRQALCQAVNLSASGMLVRTDARYPLGTTVSFQILLPEERDAVVGTAEVVRHTVPELDKLEGIGLHYLGFRSDSEARLHAYLARDATSSFKLMP